MMSKFPLLYCALVCAVCAKSASALPPVHYSSPLYIQAPPQAVGFASSLAVADFNRDGKLDVVLGDYTVPALVRVLLGAGDGTFTVATNLTGGSAQFAVATGDFNSDGKPDIVAANTGDPSISIFLGNGDGTFVTKTNFSGYSTFLAVADLDRDTHDDLIAVSGAGVTVYLGHGDGTFAAPTLYSASFAGWVAVADLNNDGILDLVTANHNFAGSVSVLLGKGDGTFETAVNYPAGSSTYSVAIGDFDNDGWPDLFAANGTSNPGTITILRNKGDGTFDLATNLPTSTYPEALTTGDFNGDGNLDLAVTYNNGGFIKIIEGDGHGRFPVATNLSAGPASINHVLAADIDGDGRPDLIKTDDSYRSASVFLNRAFPTLQIDRTGGDLALAWPRWDGFLLESAGDVLPTNGWTTLPTNGNSVVGSRNIRTNSPSAEKEFYRLRRP